MSEFSKNYMNILSGNLHATLKKENLQEDGNIRLTCDTDR
jgi:hypothetical protein